MNIAVIGGGAAGFFAAITAKERHPKSTVTIFEKNQKLLSKVKISGGGRCNVCNATTSIAALSKAYPRGSKQLKKAFQIFSTSDTVDWYAKRGVELYAQDDLRMFPTSNNSQTIIDCLLNQCKQLEVQIQLSKGVKSIHPSEQILKMKFLSGEEASFDKVIIATGGYPSSKSFNWLRNIGHGIVEPVPSLFTFNMPAENITSLMGLVAPMVQVNIQGSKLKSSGPLLITHWGMSGPAILKLSAFAARELHECQYSFKVQVNWANENNNELVRSALIQTAVSTPKKQIGNSRCYGIPERLWLYFLKKCSIDRKKIWAELPKKSLHKLVSVLCNDVYNVKGKTTFKEEFVTSGGIELSEVNFKTMQSKIHPNVYFAGEVLDIDGITGGYNFQSAWTTAFIAGQLEEA